MRGETELLFQSNPEVPDRVKNKFHARKFQPEDHIDTCQPDELSFCSIKRRRVFEASQPGRVAMANTSVAPQPHFCQTNSGNMPGHYQGPKIMKSSVGPQYQLYK